MGIFRDTIGCIVPNSSVLPIIGLPQFDGWSQVVEDRHQDGLFICAFSIEGEHAGNIGRDLVTMLEAEPPQKPRVFYQQLQKLIEHCQVNSAKLFLTAGLFDTQGCYLAAFRGGIWLKRGDKLGIVMAATDDLKVIEGEKKADDVFVFYTEPAREFLDELELKFGQGYDAQTAATSIVPSIQREDAAPTAALAVVFQSDEVEPKVDFGRIKRLQKQPASAAEPTDQNTTPIVIQSVPDQNLSARRAKKIRVRLPKIVFSKFLSLSAKAVTSSDESSDQVSAPIGLNRFGPLTLSRFKLRRAWFEPRRFLAWVILIAIFIGVSWGLWSLRQRGLARQTALNQLAPLLAELESARSLANQDPVSARQQVDSISNQLSTLRGQTKASIGLALIDEAQAKTSNLAKEISGLEEITALPQFYDLRLAKAEFIASAVAVGAGEAVFLDTERKQLLMLNLTSKSVQARVISSELSPQDIALVNRQPFLLANGIRRLEETEGQTNWEEVIAQDDANRTATKLIAFGDNLYLINPEKRAIYRYTRGEKSYNEPTNWLKTPLDFDYQLITDMIIDGDVWLSNQRGEIRRYVSGQEQRFVIDGLETPFSGSLYLATLVDLDKLYVLEPNQHRLVVLNKSGQFIRQIDSSSLSTATQIFISEQENSLFVVSGSMIYQLDL